VSDSINLPIRPALDATSAGRFNDLGTTFLAMGRFEDAQRAFRRALQIDAGHIFAHYNLGELLRRGGQRDEARRHFERALQLNPHLSPAHAGLGDTLLAQGDFQAAASCYREAIALAPIADAANYAGLGIALRELNDNVGSLAAFERAVEIDPRTGAAHFNLGSARLEFGRFDDAAVSLREALRLNPAFALGHTTFGMALAAAGDISAGILSLRRGATPETTDAQLFAMLATKLRSLGRHTAALECYQRVLDLEPNNLSARHFIQALSGVTPDGVSKDYVRQLSDAHAESFDRNLISELHYDVPRELAIEMLAVDARGPPWDILDLGCGTGLVGAALAPHARKLVGADLSPKMIERAQARNCYARLECSDLLTALGRDPPLSYDVITAADVFVYVGGLDGVVAAARRALRVRGLFGFSTEAAEDAVTVPGASLSEGYVLCTSGRYAHAESYLRDLAVRNGYEIKLLRKTRIRFEHRQPILGWLAIWQNTAISVALS
jgi:predicted TPR repeat methyltransferase